LLRQGSSSVIVRLKLIASMAWLREPIAHYFGLTVMRSSTFDMRASCLMPAADSTSESLPHRQFPPSASDPRLPRSADILSAVSPVCNRQARGRPNAPGCTHSLPPSHAPAGWKRCDTADWKSALRTPAPMPPSPIADL
jgi:hypothetical protein